MCVKCRESWKPIRARMLCSACYQEVNAEGRLEEYPRMRRRCHKIIVCAACKREKRHRARGLCATCHDKHLKANTLNQFEGPGKGHTDPTLDVVRYAPRKTRRPARRAA